MTRFAVVLCAAIGSLWAAAAAEAAEGGGGVYLLGLRSTGAGMTPPPGLFFSNQLYVYSGSRSGVEPLVGGGLIANAEASAVINIPTLVWVTPAELMGAKLGFSVTTPFGGVNVEGDVLPFLSTSDSATSFGDPAVAAFLGWNSGNFHIQSGVTTYIPIGDYTKGAIANVARHRLAADVYAAVTWLDPATGIDISNTVGITFNAKNQATDYTTGTEFHWEGAVAKRFNDNFMAGVVGYYYRQLTPDKAPPLTQAILGDFEGQVAAVGGMIGYDFKIGEAPVATRLRYYHEFNPVNRLEGDAVYLSISMPLAVY
ncbi:MAG: transporter [Rhizobiaceae bacterium]|nr:transporter [Rhizobiaceae bacterium]